MSEAPIEKGNTSARARNALRRSFRQIRANERGTRKGSDIEALHDMRVAVRRARSTIGLFRKGLSSDWKEVQSDLEWLGQRLGPVRDLDVLTERIKRLSRRKPALAESAVRPLLDQLAERRFAARSELVASLDSERYAKLLRSAKALLSKEEQWNAADEVDLGSMIEKRRRSFERAAENLNAESEPARKHRVRILAKRYRYALELLGDSLPSDRRGTPKRLARLQDALGAQQDAAVAAGLLDHLAEQHPHLAAVAMEVVARFRSLSERESASAVDLLGKLNSEA